MYTLHTHLPCLLSNALQKYHHLCDRMSLCRALCRPFKSLRIGLYLARYVGPSRHVCHRFIRLRMLHHFCMYTVLDFHVVRSHYLLTTTMNSLALLGYFSCFYVNALCFYHSIFYFLKYVMICFQITYPLPF